MFAYSLTVKHLRESSLRTENNMKNFNVYTMSATLFLPTVLLPSH